MEPSQDQSFHIQLGGEGYYTNDKEYQKELTTYQLIKNFQKCIVFFDAIVVTASFVLVILFNGLNRIAFSLVIVLRLSLTIQMIRNSNKRTKEKQEDELNEYSLRMDEELQKEKIARKHIENQIDDHKKKIQLLTGDYL
ncbi:hypothetical protein BCR36DRAFT_588522 [Piromyces finnis]|uniref:Uncharacterized protein n=1 Tax=Piromyces finnis TaxID=1754191 RepID=A0A1Y1UD74_9FUNG|nr:hypothetical protein BCR36DRAFT_588522 [Piromyces finnis]|eukprot:ORX35497.1 hypothetical protein BCR36DRAFT_588522 [Piromyces finnis]